MGILLILSDDLARAERLTRDLEPTDLVKVCDLYDEARLPEKIASVVVDVAHLDSAAVARLRCVLEPVHASGVPLALLTRDNAARAQAIAQVIGATEIISGALAPDSLRARIAWFWQQGWIDPKHRANRLAAEARTFLVEGFFSGHGITPELATTGSDLISRAIGECGIRNWIFAVRQFDNATHQHCLLVAGLAAAFATSLELGSVQSYRLTKAALLHDVGKTQIPLALLNKPSSLTQAEMIVMRTHAIKGYEMLKDGGFAQEILSVARSHHELLDGSGYPDALKGDQIPDLVRLVTICDIFGALIERRAYKPPMPAAKAYSMLQDMKDRLDVDLVRLFQPVVAAMA